MYDHYEHQQDEYYRQLKEKRARKKQFINTVVHHLLFLMAGNAFPFAIYIMFLSKLVNERIAREKPVALLVCLYGLIAQIVVLIIFSVLTYSKNEDEHRALLHASREDGFSAHQYYLQSWTRSIWLVPLAYLIMQLPFALYYAVLGYYYQAETLFAKFFIPQLCLCEVTGSGFLGVLLNTLLLSLIYGVVVYVVQQRWLRDRIRV